MVLSTVAYGQTAEESINNGKTELALKNYASALQFFNKAIETNSAIAEAYKLKGNAEFGLKKYRRAKASYSKAIELDPDFTTAYFNRGIANQELGFHRKAIADYNVAIAKNPNYTKAYRNRGNAKEWVGDHAGSKADYFKAREIELKNEEILEKDSPEATDAVRVENVVKDSTESSVATVVAKTYSKSIVVDMSAFSPAEKEINYAGVQLQSARRTFGVGLFLNLLGGALATGGSFANNQKVRTGLIVAGGVTSVVGSIVMITAIIPIGGAGKILQKVQFPKTIRIDVE